MMSHPRRYMNEWRALLALAPRPAVICCAYPRK
jgi:hypothetical protein